MPAPHPALPAVYVRWSTEEQGAGTTLEEQRQTCLAFLQERGWPIDPDRIFIDDGYSAGSLERPAMRALRQAVRAGRVDAVVVYKLDRLTRNIVDAVDLVLREWEGRCALVSVTQAAIDTTTPLGRQFFTLMASFAEFERELIRERTLSGKRRRALQGRNPGFRPPYGYRRGPTPGSIAVDPDRAEVVRRIFALYATGLGTPAVARQLNAEGIPAPGGAPAWQDRTVRYILANPLYAGRLEYGRTSVNPPRRRELTGRHRTVHPSPRHAAVAGAVPAIVPPDLWRATRAVLAARRAQGGSRRAAASSFLLSGLLRCRCGAACAGVRARGTAYYRCRGGPGRCQAGSIPCAPLDALVLQAVREQVQGHLLQGVAEAAARQAAARRQALARAVTRHRGALAALEKQRRQARRDYLAGELPARLYGEVDAALAAQQAREEAALRDAASALAGAAAPGRPAAAGSPAAAEGAVAAAWDQLDVAQRKQVLRLLVPGLVAYRERGSPTVTVAMTLARLAPGSGALQLLEKGL